ncbi:ribonuclease P protein subunit p14 [Euwallacea fornicatus]|uniref:ribonuclease P protein subunit p14 n=1 Tax=Euwallacea fornicatus TaxID=995702 RepID=UPI00338E34B7
MNNYHYLDIKLILQNPEEVTPAFFKKNILEGVKQLFGEVGSSVNIDVLKFDPHCLEGIIRIPKSQHIKIRGSLTLYGWYESQSCIYRVRKSAPLLLGLLGDSREYIH